MEENNRVTHPRIVVIGGSAGSLRTILEILPNLEPKLQAAIIIVLHRHHVYDSTLTDLLAIKTTLPVKEAEEKEDIQPGTIYIAPSDYHLLVESDYSLSLDYSEKVNYSRPSIDVTLSSAAPVCGARMAALLLSGGNNDGTDGLDEVQSFGGTIAVQDPIDAEVDYMPKHALQTLQVPFVLKNHEMADFINRFAAEDLV
ncbi:chemotaxis protein CheB [Chitinophaga horti]|uniref:protein-glutamate methylesterase n=1 Tax=Chitinophaga horti TaxID=2920382 RepID=A0ABY6J0J8_9BACT|nr:chemotaxis protein CheB [Chitinophaga horti]UYQ93177.1 chemotaxis protein CheB [Chitinophaga horti]